MNSLDGIDAETKPVSAEPVPGSHSMATSQHHLSGEATMGLDLDLKRRFDLTGPFREHLDQLGRCAGDLGLTVHDRLPADPEAV